MKIQSLLKNICTATAFIALTNCATDELAGLTTRDTTKTDASALASDEAAATAKKEAAAAADVASPENDAMIARSLASTDGKLEQSFTKLMNSPQASDYINQEMNRVQVLHALSDGYLKAFDASLDSSLAQISSAQAANGQASNDRASNERASGAHASTVAPSSASDLRVLENQAYAQLLATRRLLDETESRLNYFLYRALETKWSEDVRPEHKQSAVQLVGHFKYNVERRGEFFSQPAMQELAHGFATASEQAHANYISQYAGTPPVGLARDLSQVLGEVFAQASGSAPVTAPISNVVLGQTLDGKSAAAKTLPADVISTVSKDIGTLVKDIQANWKTEADERGSETGKAQPSSGADGTIDGTRFKNSTWAITFDDGPSNHDDAILRELDSHHVRATFFWVAQNVMDQKDRVKAASLMGMNLGNHSFTNFDLGRNDATPERVQHEVVDAAAVDAKVYGYRPTLFRCPYGSCLESDQVRQLLEDQKFIHVQWNIDGIDWKDHHVNSVYARIRKEMRLEKHGIIVMRDTQFETSKILADLLQDLTQDKSTRIVTVQEAIDESNAQ